MTKFVYCVDCVRKDFCPNYDYYSGCTNGKIQKYKKWFESDDDSEKYLG